MKQDYTYSYAIIAIVFIVAIVGLLVSVPLGKPTQQSLEQQTISENNTLGLATSAKSLQDKKTSSKHPPQLTDAVANIDASPIIYTSCYDSDGGKVYSEFGSVKAVSQTGARYIKDSCNRQNKENGLVVFISEKYCDTDNRPLSTQYRCGGVCYENECEEITQVTKAYYYGDFINVSQTEKSGSDVCMQTFNRTCELMYYRTLDGQFRELPASLCDVAPTLLAQNISLHNGYASEPIVDRIFWFEGYGVQYLNHTSGNAYLINTYFPNGQEGINGPVVDGSTYCPENFCFEFDHNGAIAHAYYQDHTGSLTAEFYAVCVD